MLSTILIRDVLINCYFRRWIEKKIENGQISLLERSERFLFYSITKVRNAVSHWWWKIPGIDWRTIKTISLIRQFAVNRTKLRQTNFLPFNIGIEHCWWCCDGLRFAQSHENDDDMNKWMDEDEFIVNWCRYVEYKTKSHWSYLVSRRNT